MAARPVTPASPKNVKVKTPAPGTPMYGCGMRIPVYILDSSISFADPTGLHFRACAAPVNTGPRSDEQLHLSLQNDPTRDLRYDSRRPADNEQRWSSRYLNNLKFSLPPVSDYPRRERTIESWVEEAA
jgi:hypothetical protein